MDTSQINKSVEQLVVGKEYSRKSLDEVFEIDTFSKSADTTRIGQYVRNWCILKILVNFKVAIKKTHNGLNSFLVDFFVLLPC